MSIFNVNETLIYSILGIICLTFILIAIIKFPESRWFVGTILSIVLVISAIYSATQLNVYYNEFGGIYGQLTGVFDTNNVVRNDMTFDFNDIVLTEVSSNGSVSTYEAKFVLNEVLDLSLLDNYGVYINGTPVEIVDSGSDYIIAKYEYMFMDRDLSVLCADTLNIEFVFYNNSTMCIVYTNGGADAVKYWNYYFNKNAFNVELKEIGGIYG